MDISKKELTRTSKFLSLVLRHRPEFVGLTLDEAGWVDVDALLEACRDKRTISRELLELVVETNDKKRFAFSEDGTRIRANQGHSVKIDLGLAPSKPPRTLYHGTVDKFVPSILRQGLLPRKRTHVHLSADVETAQKVGSRRGKPIILEVDAARMEAEGFEFYVSDNGVWLANKVPARYLKMRA